MFSGWDIRSTKLGNALLSHQILDYDLVRRVQAHLNSVEVLKGVYDERFLSDAVAATVSHAHECASPKVQLERIRADIRLFKDKNKVGGHTTVIWSASVEPNSPLSRKLDSADDLLKAFEEEDEEKRGGAISPSLIYATAAILEGCSFVNGGSQNTLCEGLSKLAESMEGVYVLGTDFKAGQTKFKTAAVEYLRACGFTPRTIASCNHLGNNDMKNISSSNSVSDAKLKVKHDIFGGWGENIDHKVRRLRFLLRLVSSLGAATGVWCAVGLYF